MSDHKANAEALDIALYGTPDIYTPPEEFMPRRASIAEKLAELYPDRGGHDAEAERLIEFARDSGSESAAMAAVAQATRALAEQQKRTADEAHTANLIAFLDAEGGPYKEINNIVGGRASVIEQVAEGLGLSDAHDLVRATVVDAVEYITNCRKARNLDVADLEYVYEMLNNLGLPAKAAKS